MVTHGLVMASFLGRLAGLDAASKFELWSVSELRTPDARHLVAAGLRGEPGSLVWDEGWAYNRNPWMRE